MTNPEPLQHDPVVSSAVMALGAPQRYRTILADPPWDIQQKGGLGASQHYRLMTLDRIKAMPVADLAEDDAHLWLWVTNATLRDGYDVMEAWGFMPRSPLTWIKPRLGLGTYLRNSTEHLLFGTRGRAPVKFKAQPTWMFAPLQDHSHKPEEQYAVIERISQGPFLELFARRPQPGWHCWGDQTDSHISIPGYPVPSDLKIRALDPPNSEPRANPAAPGT
ncbi:MT-A70 family methyltransferase [Rhodococcus sp. ACS1]|uniref:MT-A70 family methyltransferase n=1 Tax=Rhodococcus sp. ACS1 TaxID=2028570 RepID=UPI00211C551E|nr:MT-A70 family methyltransferase [Rhodococcus sp. ACS1]